MPRLYSVQTLPSSGTHFSSSHPAPAPLGVWGPGRAWRGGGGGGGGGRAARRMWYIMQSVQSKYSLSERLIRTIAAIRSFPRDNVEDLIGRVSDGGPEPSPLIKGRRKGAVARPHVGLQLLAGGRALSSAL